VRLGEALAAPVRQLVAAAWAFRLEVERAATVQFERLAHGLEAEGAPGRLVDVAARAASEERRHGALCGELAAGYGGQPTSEGPSPPALAPEGLGSFAALSYAMVAHCCVAETESVATLTTLIRRAGPPEVRQALVAIARDEVEHAQLGWAFVAWARQGRSLSFLGAYLPRMLAPGAGALFEPAPAESEDPRLVEHGVLPRALKRQVFRASLEDVVLPGLASASVDGAPARRWLAERMRAGSAP